MSVDNKRIYERSCSVVFLKTNERFGGLSNMAGGFPLHILGVRIPSTEALYQACRYPHLPHVQQLIIEQTSPMTAKMKSKPYRRQSRSDWNRVRVAVMRWCLRVKLAQNWERFSKLLLQTGDRPIVEESRRDDFWGAKSVNEQTLVGMNVLGRLLMELRELIKFSKHNLLMRVEPPAISDFMFLGRPISEVVGTDDLDIKSIAAKMEPAVVAHVNGQQPFLFNTSVALENQTLVIKSEDRNLLANLNPYEATTRSGVAWLNDIPAHWKLARAKWLFRKVERPVRDTDEVVTCFRDGTVTLRKNRRVRGFTESLKEIGYQGVRRGDLVIHTMDAFAGAIGVADSDGKSTPVYSVCEPLAEANPFYYGFILREMARSQWIQALAKGIRERSSDFRFDDFGAQVVPIPPIQEQQAIVRFLNYADRHIHRYIRARQKLITCLEEQEQTIIHRTVTRGLNPNVRLKPSGVEWLGDVPARWEVRRIKQSSRIVRGKFTHRPRNDETLYGGPYPFIQTGEVARAKKSITKYRQTLNERGLAVSKMFTAGTLVMTIAANIGDVAVLDFDACFPDSVVGFVPREAIERDYLYYVFGAMKPELLRETPVNTQGNLNVDRIGSRKIPVPPISEQREIVRQIEENTNQLAVVIDKAEREIRLIREYRTRLVSDVVSGKLDVRDIAARLQELKDEPESAGLTDVEPDSNRDAITIEETLDPIEV